MQRRQRSGEIVRAFRPEGCSFDIVCEGCDPFGKKRKDWLEEDNANGCHIMGGTFYCAKCWDDYECCTDPFLQPSEQFVKACFLQVDDVFDDLFDGGVCLSKPADIGNVWRIDTPQAARKTCSVRMTAVAALCLTGTDDDIYKLIKAGADYQTPAKCLSCSNGSCATVTGIGKAPLEVARERGLDMQWIDSLVSSGKRPRRTTPVKQRAAKIGVELPPTPSGIREALADGDDDRKRKARRLLQRHQKACHQKVDRVEKEREFVTATNHGPGSETADRASVCYFRNKALANQAKARSWERNKEKWLAARNARNGEVNARLPL